MQDDRKERGTNLRKLHPYGAVKFTWEVFVDENPNWEQTILDLAQEGDGKTTWKVYLGLNERTYQRFLEQEEFVDAIEKAEALELMYWEREARRMVSGDPQKHPGAGKGNGFIFALIMRNKFGWDNKNLQATIDPRLLPPPVEESTKPMEIGEADLRAELMARGLPEDIFQSYVPAPINYELEASNTIDAEYTEL